MTKYAYHDVRKIRDLRDMFYQSSRLFVDQTAFLIKREHRGPYEAITFRDLRKDVEALGTALMRLFEGQEERPRFAILAGTRYEWYLSYLATLLGEGIIVPLDRQLEPGELHGMLKRAKVQALFFGKTEAQKAYQAAEGLEDLTTLIAYDEKAFETIPESLDGVKRCLFQDLMDEGREAIEQGDQRFFNVEIDPDEMRILIYTSGTTSKAKAVMHSHKTVCANIMDMCEMVYVGPKDVFLSILPLNHTYECTCGFLVPIYRGATIAICEGYRHIIKNLNESHATVMLIVPLIAETIQHHMIRQLKKDPPLYRKVKRGLKLSSFLFSIGIDVRRKIFRKLLDKLGGSLRMVISGGASIEPQTLMNFEAVGLLAFQGYGLTEFTPILAVNRDVEYKHEAAGLPLRRNEIKIDNPDENGVGEILARGPSLMLGYYEDEEATEAAMKDGFFRTSDLGYIDDDGFIILTGRKQNLIVNKAGKNIYPEELEAIFMKSDWIKECQVTTEPAPRGEDLLVLYVYPDEETVTEHFGKDVLLDSSAVEEQIDHFVTSENAKLPCLNACVKCICAMNHS